MDFKNLSQYSVRGWGFLPIISYYQYNYYIYTWTFTGMRGNLVSNHSSFISMDLAISPIVIGLPPPAFGSISYNKINKTFIETSVLMMFKGTVNINKILIFTLHIVNRYLSINTKRIKLILHSQIFTGSQRYG